MFVKHTDFFLGGDFALLVWDLFYSQIMQSVVGLPALSPTMETGVLAEWYIQEGSSFAAGDAIAKIETDKASIDFEAQDDGFVAKILMEAGDGADIKVGTPILVTVEEEEHVTAFANFKAPTATPAPAPAVAAAAAVPPPPPPPPSAPPVVVAAAAVVPPTPVVVATPAPVVVVPPPSPPSMQAMIAAVAPVLSTGWGQMAKINSPLAKTLSKAQKDYIAKYGTTGQIPL
jgi:pyruvate dehydrogenase E2 component (dihydrolipoamide acetyltransferase)